MNRQLFLDTLSQEGYPEPVEVSQPANGFLDLHTHPFAVKALVVDGSIEIAMNNIKQRFEVGDVFELHFAQEHSEAYGPTGVRYLASRKTS